MLVLAKRKAQKSPYTNNDIGATLLKCREETYCGGTDFTLFIDLRY